KPLVDVESDAAGPHEAPTEATAANGGRGVQKVTAEAATKRRGRKEPDVVRECTEVPCVVCESLELEANRPDREGSRRHAIAGERLYQMTVRRGVADGRIARQGLRVVDRPLRGPAEERAFDTPMLVAEGDFQMKHLLS